MGILQQIADRIPARRGKASDPIAAVSANIAAIDEALAEIDVSRAAAKQTLADGEARKRELLIEDAGLDAIDLHDRTLREARYNLDALSLWETRQRGIRADLVKSRDAMTADRMLAKWIVAGDACVRAMQAADVARQAVLAINDEMRMSGHYALASRLPVPPQALADDLIAQFAGDLARCTPGHQVATTTPPAPRPVPRIVAKAPPWQAPAPMPKPARPVLGARPDGAVKVVILRGGLELNGAQYLAGEEAWMMPDAANAACRAGGVEIIEGEAAA